MSIKPGKATRTKRQLSLSTKPILQNLHHTGRCHFYSGRPSFIYLQGFLSIEVCLTTITNHRTAGEGGGHFFNSSLPIPPASQMLRHQPGECCRELTSARRQYPDSKRKPFRKSLTTKLSGLEMRLTLQKDAFILAIATTTLS